MEGLGGIMRTVALEIEIEDLRPEYAGRKPWHILGSDVMTWIDGRWGRARTLSELVRHARAVSGRYCRTSDYRATLVGYTTLGTGTSRITPLPRVIVWE